MSATQSQPTTSFEITNTFLTNVLPPDPICYIAWRADDRWRHKPFTADIPKATDFARFIGAKSDVWFTLAGFKVEKIQRGDYMACSRTQDNVNNIRALILDVDCKDYGDLKATLSAFTTAYEASKMPPPSYIINSGGGLHIYWLLEESMTPEMHLRKAKLLVSLFRTNGLKADYGCSRDCARVLRAPGTWNYKYDPPREVKILLDFTGFVSPDALNDALGSESDAGLVIPLDLRQATIEERNAALSDPHSGGKQASFAIIAEKCPTVAHAIETAGADASYGLWKNLLHLAAYAEGGNEFIHAMSSGHPGYKVEDTNFKYQESVNVKDSNPSVGPTTCEAFSEDSEACKTCKHFGTKLKTPCTLGFLSHREQLLSGDDPTYVLEGATFWNTFVADKDSDAATKAITVRVMNLELTDFVLNRWVDGEEDNILSFNATEGDLAFKINISAAKLADVNSAKLAETLGRRAIMMQPGALKNLRGALMAWVTMLRTRSRPGSSQYIDTSGYGWCQKDGELIDSFAYDGIIYQPDGLQVSGSPHPDLEQTYRCVGDLDLWKKAAAKLCEDPRTAMQAVLAASFAAPLMRYFPDTASFTISLVSPTSGTGKTTALRVAAAVWAEPVQSMRQLNDTQNSVIKHVSLARDMPAYWDDVRDNKRADEFTQVMFLLTQGRDKGRLDRSARTTQSGLLRTILTVASNTSIMARVSDQDQSSDATARRVLEFELSRLPNTGMDQSVRETFHAAKTNYGHAGTILAAWLPQNIAQIKAWRAAMLTLLTKETTAKNEDRFWIDACSAILVGALIARHLDLAPINLEALAKFLINHIRNQQVNVVEAVKTAAQVLLADIIHANSDYTLQCRRPPIIKYRPGVKHKTSRRHRIVEKEPLRKSVTVEIDRDDRTLILGSPSLSRYLAARRGSSHTLATLRSTLSQQYNTSWERQTLGAGTVFSGGQVWSLKLSFITDKEFAGVLAD
jgi:hypothetical protein